MACGDSCSIDAKRPRRQKAYLCAWGRLAKLGSRAQAMLALGSLALALARPEALIPEQQYADLAHQLSTGGNVHRQFTCMVDDIDKTCPGVKALSKLNQHLADLRPSVNRKWLFYGPSHMSQLFQVVLAANRENIVEEGDIVDDAVSANLTTYADITAAFATANSLVANDAACGDPLHTSECNIITDPDCKCKSELSTAHVKLKNGAELYAIVNSRVFQDQSNPEVMQLLQDWLNLPDLKLDQIWYMEPHVPEYWKEHDRAIPQGDAHLQAADASGHDMCYQVINAFEEVALGGNKTGVIQTPTTMTQYVNCVKEKPAFKKLRGHVDAHGTSMMIVAPWAVQPEAWTKDHLAEVYSMFEAGHKYPCVAGGSAPGQDDYGIGNGACSSPLSAKDLAMSKYASKNVHEDVFYNSKQFYQNRHVCSVICEPKNGPNACIPGPVARMALDMVTRARGTSTSATWEGYDGFNDANDMSQVFDMQNACEEASQQS